MSKKIRKKKKKQLCIRTINFLFVHLQQNFAFVCANNTRQIIILTLTNYKNKEIRCLKK